MTTTRLGRPQGHRRCAVAVVAAAVFLVPAASVASAQSTLPENNAGTGQYVEPVPDAAGDRRAEPGGGAGGPGGRGGGGAPSLPRDVRDALPPGEEGRALERFATDPGSGAPAGGGAAGGGSAADGGRDGSASGSGSASDGAGDTRSQGIVSALASAATGDDGAEVPVLLLAVLALTVAFGAVGLRTRQRGA